MSEIPKPFEFTISGKPYVAELGKCAIALFRQKQQVDYLAVDMSEEGEEQKIFRIFNNLDLVRWMAGLAIIQEDGDFSYRSTYWSTEGEEDGRTFYEMFGWSPTVVIKSEPFEWEEEQWAMVNTKELGDNFVEDTTGNIDDEWEKFNGG